MALLAYEGFDHYLNGTDLLQRNSFLQWTVNAGSSGPFASPGFNGTGKYFSQSGSSFSAILLAGSWASNLATGFVGQRFFLAPSNTGQPSWTRINFQDSTAGVTQFRVFFDSLNGAVSIEEGSVAVSTPGSGTVATSANNVFPINAWFYAEVSFTVSHGGGSVDVHVNGNSVVSFSGDNQNSTNSWANGHYYVGWAGGTTGIDDIYICDSTAGLGTFPCDSFLGDVVVLTTFPIADTATEQWTPLSGTLHYTEVDEIAMDSDTTYNATATAGNVDLFTFGTLSGSPTVLAVAITGAYKQDASGQRKLVQRLKSGSAAVSGSTVSLSTGYVYQSDIFPVDPNTSSSWTTPNANAISAGYSLSV